MDEPGEVTLQITVGEALGLGSWVFGLRSEVRGQRSEVDFPLCYSLLHGRCNSYAATGGHRVHQRK